MPREPHDRADLTWIGLAHGPTTSYPAYSRGYAVAVAGKSFLVGSADPRFCGDASLHNPEDLLVAALSGCHLLSYLAECARVGFPVLHDPTIIPSKADESQPSIEP